MKRILQVSFCWFLVCFSSLASGETLYKVYLTDGRILIGRLSDQGNKVELAFRKGKVSGKVWILKKDIIKYEPIEVKGLPKKVLRDLIVLTDGRQIEGKIIKKALQRIYIKLFKYGSTAIVGYKRSQIQEIIYAKDRLKRQKNRPPSSISLPNISETFSKKIIQTILLLQSHDTGKALEARKDLLSLGIFATSFLQKALPKKKKLLQKMEALQKRAPQVARSGIFLFAPAMEGKIMPLKRAILLIQEILGIGKVKKLVTPQMEEKVRYIYSRLASNSSHIRLEVLKEIVLYAPKSTPPLLSYFINQERESPRVKAFCISQLGILGQSKALIRIYEHSHGQLKFAAAMALGDNGIYLGLPTLIDALSIENIKIRAIAIKKLKEYTEGIFFGYFPKDSLKRRQKAILQWKKWWKENSARITSQSLSEVFQQGKISPLEKKKGLFWWKKGLSQWEKAVYTADPKKRSLLVDSSLVYLEKSLRYYPTFVSARFNLAKILYKEKKEYKRALKNLRLLLTQYRTEAGELGQKLAYYHMGTIYSRQEKWDQAIFRYRRAITMDSHYVDGHIGLAYTYFEKAAGSKASISEIRKIYKQSLNAYQKALKALQYTHIQLVKSSLPQDPQWVLVKNNFTKVSYGDYASSNKILKGMIYFQMGKAYLALKQYGLAISKFREALKWAPNNLKYKEALKFWEAEWRK